VVVSLTLQMRVVDGQWHHRMMPKFGGGGWGGCGMRGVDDTGEYQSLCR